jgi:hypothetical protein
MVFGIDKHKNKNKGSTLVFQPGFKDQPPKSTVMPVEPAPVFTPPMTPAPAPEPVGGGNPNDVVWVENAFGQKLKTKRKNLSKNDTVIANPNEVVDLISGMFNNSAAYDADTEDTVEVDDTTGHLTVNKKKKGKSADYTAFYIAGGIVFGSFIIVGLAGN